MAIATQRNTTDRRLVLIDIENLVGPSHRSTHQVQRVFHRLYNTLGDTTGDTVVTATGRKLLREATAAFPTRVVIGHGIDGADLRLLEEMVPDRVAGRYRSVVLASGDTAAFAPAVAGLNAVGVPTDVVLGAGRAGAALHRLARSVTALGDHFTSPAAAA
jgi:hypothetical protein